MRSRRLVVLLGVAVLMTSVTAASAASGWRDPAKPFDYVFLGVENHINNHQQSLARNDMLEGFFYIDYQEDEFGEPVIDPGSGLQEALHTNCFEHPDQCEAGWVWHGVFLEDVLYCGHITEISHPTWLIEGADKYLKRGYTHFHWSDSDAPAHGQFVPEVGRYDGYLMRLTAVNSFFFPHHGTFEITPGIDWESHKNYVTDPDDCKPVPHNGGH